MIKKKTWIKEFKRLLSECGMDEFGTDVWTTGAIKAKIHKALTPNETIEYMMDRWKEVIKAMTEISAVR